MEWLKINAEGEIEFVTEEVKLVPEVQAMLTLNYNKEKGDLDGRKKTKSKREFKYLYLVHSPGSPYKDYISEKERVEEAKQDCGFGPTWVESPELKAVIPKYKKGTTNRVTQSFNRTLLFLDKFHTHLETIQLDERTLNGAVVHSPKAIMQTLEELPGFLMKMEELEKQVRNGTLAAPTAKGDQEVGWMAMRVEPTKKSKQIEDEPRDEDS